jgi:hypothetical protein
MLARLDLLDNQAATVGRLTGVILDVNCADAAGLTDVELTANGETLYVGRADVVGVILWVTEKLLTLATAYAGDDPF